MILRTQAGDLITLAEPIGKGGEATIHALKGHPRTAAKIYSHPTPERLEKLRAMLAHPPHDPMRSAGHVSICWPQDVLFNAAGQGIGFTMPRLDLSRNRELFKLYNPASRTLEAPNFTWSYLLRTAENIASVVDSLHAAHYVIGDINESNFFVSDQALVTLVDCDSMQAGPFRCTVAKPEYLAPELHGLDLTRVDRAPAHDDFALAVLIFLLVMEGVHPYSGIWQARGEAPSLHLRIANNDYPYAPTIDQRILPMPSAPPFDMLPPTLQGLFFRAFIQGHTHPASRPAPKEWQQALRDLGQSLSTCTVNPRHEFSPHLKACPWCARTILLRGLDPYPTLKPVSKSPTQTPLRPNTFTPTVPKRTRPPIPITRPTLPPPQPRSTRRIGLSIVFASIVSAAVTLWLAFNLLANLLLDFAAAACLLAALFGLLLNLRRFRLIRAFIDLCLALYTLAAIIRPPAIPAFILIPLSALATYFAARSLLLQLRPRMELQTQKSRVLAAESLLIVALVIPPTATLALAQLTATHAQFLKAQSKAAHTWLTQSLEVF
ncbi:helix-hairpin-helix domain-containing protein [Granulicella tundricola]|uniref:Protein kinase domain-containing protein n=1 Tax=Granulicella tundricola (strain ATCC BAA-1859 / DSM 23138 / MP5ACTX9) TaxID=1198114 RepID=E8X661_GRATM|nr:hypothetical protein [Granulicella tundricola]ADW70945.1 hypothetical protein AciX9_4165 [Granulicella tundricola MP5ACTX9]